ncbi:hypothetical protein GLA29479_2666 [Lysobacter antibioticus]|nr:hypothetical protein GLA29479_2666 [Lysobacter antibioticus]
MRCRRATNRCVIQRSFVPRIAREACDSAKRARGRERGMHRCGG